MLGFFAKYGVLLAAVDAGLTWLAVAGVVASVIGAYYYLRIVYFMYFGDPDARRIDGTIAPLNAGLLLASAAIMLLGIVNMFGIEGLAEAAAASLVN